MANTFPAEYRQGYLKGYQKAFEDLIDLLKRDTYSFEEAEEICRTFWTDDLYDWLADGGDLPTLVIPAEESRPVTTTVDPDAVPADPYEDKTA